MKLGALEKYGLRCLLQIGRYQECTGEGLTILEISQAEGLSAPNVAKIMRMLRIGGFVESARGHAGGYSLARPPDQILIGDVLTAMGGRLFDPSLCKENAGMEDLCPHYFHCSIRSVWRTLQFAVDQALNDISLENLLVAGQEFTSCLERMADDVLQVVDVE